MHVKIRKSKYISWHLHPVNYFVRTIETIIMNSLDESSLSSMPKFGETEK
jgi:hypothetical protein